MEDSNSLNKAQSNSQKNKSSSNAKGKTEQNTISSKLKKKKSDGTEDIDLTNKILSNLCYEDFESENDKFYTHYHKNYDEIYIDNVSLLDQNRFRFLISNNASIFNEYTKYENGNFKNIKWEDIKLVYYYYVEDYQCPICLEKKICCPIIINCGHIFCYPCFLNFYNYYTVESVNKKIPNCPLCSEKINLEKNEVKFCEMIKCQNYTNNMEIKFNLIMREKTSPTLFNLCYDPSLKKWKQSLKYQMRSIPLEISKEFLFSRIFSTNKKLTNARINNLLKDVKEELKDEIDFYADENKIKSLNQCIEILNKCLKENEQKKDFILESVFQKQSNNNINDNKTIDNSNNKLDIKNNNNDKILENQNNKENMNNLNDEEINYKKYFLFYQEEEGDIYYLHPFIMEILLTEYGDYSNLPVEITGNIIDFEMKQVTPYLKSTYSYLSHLNIGSIIFFVEIDVNPLISASTRKKYSHALNERAKKRRLLSNEEKNYEKFINKKKIKEQEELKNYYSKHFYNLKELIKEQKENEEKKIENNNNINENNNVNNDDNLNNNNLENNNDENKNKENVIKENDKEIKKENRLKKLFEENDKEKEEKEREEKERIEKLEKEKKEKEKKERKNFIFDENDFPELNKINEKEKEKEKEKGKDKDKEEEKEKEKVKDKEEEKEKEGNNINNNVNKGGKKGKKKGKKKFQEVTEDFFKDTFNPDEKEGQKGKDKKTKGKKSSKNN